MAFFKKRDKRIDLENFLPSNEFVTIFVCKNRYEMHILEKNCQRHKRDAKSGKFETLIAA